MADTTDTTEEETGLGLCWFTLDREARMVAYLCCKERAGKVKLNELHQMDRVRDAVLDGCKIDQKTGKVDWVKGIVKLDNDKDFEMFARMVLRYLEDEGVDFDLTKAAIELKETVESKEGELREFKKSKKAEAKAEKDAERAAAKVAKAAKRAGTDRTPASQD